MLLAKKDDAALRAVMEQVIRASDLDHRMRVAFDPGATTGLVDGASLGFFEFALIDAGSSEVSAVRRLEAVYNASNGGFTVRATDGTDPLGIELDVANPEVVLRLRLAGSTLFMEAGAPTGPFVVNIDTTELHAEPLAEAGAVAHTFAWGVAGLGKAGRMYFSQLGLWGPLPDIGEAETPIAQQLMAATLSVSNALYPDDVASATDTFDAMAALLGPIVADLTSAVDGDLFNATAQGKRALRNAQKALTLAQKAKAAGEKQLAAGKTSTKALGKKARTIALRTILALVQVGGFRSNSPGKALKTAAYF